MLVFRRAVSLFLSALLAYTPTLAWARPATVKTKPQSFVAASKVTYQKSLAKNIPAKKANGALPKLSASNLMTGGEVFERLYPTVPSKAGDLTVIREPGANGKVKTQIVRGKRYEEILVDEYGNGTASFWQVTKGNTKFTATNPLNGRFTKLEVEERRAKAIVKTRFYFTRATQQYRVSGVEVLPYKKDGRGDSVIAKTCELEEAFPSLGTELEKFQKFLHDLNEKNPTQIDIALSCKLKRLQDLFVDDSCRTPEFKDSIEPMLEGLAKVLSSRKPSGSGNYLQCAEDHGFAVNSAAIQRFFVNQKSAVQSALISAGSAVDPFSDDSCDRLETLPIGSTGETKKVADLPIPGQTKKMISCDSSTVEPAQWDQQANHVIMGRPRTAIANAIGLKWSATDAYADVFMHELLHESGMPDPGKEILVQNLEKCCSSPLGVNGKATDRSKEGCRWSDDYAAEHLVEQTMEAVLSRMPTYDDLTHQTEVVLGKAESEAFITKWQSGFYNDSTTAKAIDSLRLCWAIASGDKIKQNGCAQKAEVQFEKYTDKYVRTQCPAFATVANANPTRCEDLRATFVSVIRSQSPTSQIVRIPRIVPIKATFEGSAQSVELSSIVSERARRALNPLGGLAATIVTNDADSNEFWKLMVDPARATKLGIAHELGKQPDGYQTVSKTVTPDNEKAQAPRNSPGAVANQASPADDAVAQAPSQQRAAEATAPVISTATTPPPAPRQLTTIYERGATPTSTTLPADTSSVMTESGTNGAAQAPTQEPSLNSPDDQASTSASNALTSSARTPGILSSAQTQSPIPMGSMARNASTRTLGQSDSAVTGFADTKIGNTIVAAATSAGAILRDGLISSANASGVTDLIRAPANVDQPAQVYANTTSSSGFSSASSAAPRNNRQQASLAAAPSSSASTRSRTPAEEQEPSNRSVNSKKAAADKAVPADSDSQTQDGAKAAKSKDEPPNDEPQVISGARLAAVENTPLARRYSSGTLLDRQLSSAHDEGYASMKTQLHDKNWIDLMIVRGRQVRLESGLTLGSRNPISCWREDARAKRFELTKCRK